MAQNLKIGDKITHKILGDGVVLDVRVNGKKTEAVIVRFKESVGVRKLQEKFLQKKVCENLTAEKK